jgi:putative tryptophan/tyrosine transport system substrate-binding protein
MRRREFIAVVAGTVAWPLPVRAQQSGGVRRLGVLFAGTHSDLNDQQIAAFTKSLQQLGWREGQNIRIDYRWAANDVAQLQWLARELLSLKPDVFLAITTAAVEAVQRETSTTPIVFVAVTDPVISGFVASMSHPGGNITGFSNFEPSLAGKYVEILKGVIPDITEVVMMSSSYNPARLILRPLLEAAGRYHNVELIPAEVRNDSDIERVVSGLGDKPLTGLFVLGEPFLSERLPLVVSLTIRHRVRSVSSFRYFPAAGGLISYGNDLFDQYRQAAPYVDRLLKGESTSNLPVQAPTKFELVINLKTAKAIGASIPPSLLAAADEVIE